MSRRHKLADRRRRQKTALRRGGAFVTIGELQPASCQVQLTDQAMKMIANRIARVEVSVIAEARYVTIRLRMFGPVDEQIGVFDLDTVSARKLVRLYQETFEVTVEQEVLKALG